MRPRIVRVAALVAVLVALGAGAAWWRALRRGGARGRGAEHVHLPADAFNVHVRSTPARSPEEERLGFHVPPGFEVQLFASEPLIGKPVNIAFDHRGRLWVTETVEYPSGAAGAGGRDRVVILEDTDGDGRADRATTFAEGLNIPVGVVPVAGGAIVYSIPYVYRFFDLDGDDRADTRVVLYGKFDHLDTHGMVSSFTRGFDGWIYAHHGFTNKSVITSRDGSSVTLDSGNTFRMLEDGSRLELYAHGQVNPFGLAFDARGDLFSADCHTQAVYQLLGGADYPHFIRPETGIGFGPAVMDHDHGSTAIAGIALYEADRFPAEYRGNVFTGNVVTCRINRDVLEERGSTRLVVHRPDFLQSDDPWFRPVDLEVGPDGALYVADFYNRIIAHVEVPLVHKGRDHERGRIWRIVPSRSRPIVPRRWDHAPAEALVRDLGDPNLTVRMIATDELVDRVGRAAVEPVRRALESGSSLQKAHALWVLRRLDALGPDLAARATADADAIVRIHAARALAASPAWGARERELALAALSDRDASVVRAGVEALRVHPAESSLEPLLALASGAPAADRQLVHTVRMALREHLAEPAILAAASGREWADADRRALVEAALGVDTPAAGAFVLEWLERGGGKLGEARLLAHGARHVPEPLIPRVLAAARRRARDGASAPGIFKVVAAGLAERGLAERASVLRPWGRELVTQLLASKEERGLRAAFEIGAAIEERSLEPRMRAALTDRALGVETRGAAADALASLAPERSVQLLGELLRSPGERIEVQARALAALRRIDSSSATAQLVEALRVAPARLQSRIAVNLVGRDDTARALLDAVGRGRASPQLLLRTGVQNRLRTLSPETAARADALTRGIEPEDDSMERSIDGRRAAFRRSPGRSASGAAVFEKYCTRCHQIAGRGKTIGPQLDGIGSRGLDRLLEDILDPSRSVESAFRVEEIRLRNGSTVSGVVARDDAEALLVVDDSGAEVRVPKMDVRSRRQSNLSAMPADLAEQIPAADFNDLLAFLLSTNRAP